MKSKIFKISILTLFLIPIRTEIRGQNHIDTLDQLHLISAYFENPSRVVLRWVPSTPGLLRQCNYFGYRLERAEIDTLQKRPLVWIELSKIRPLDLEKWKNLVKQYPNDTLLMVSGQAIHGERDSSPLTLDNMLKKSDQLQNYYSACILAAEFSPVAAIASALRYEDKKIDISKSYLYRLTITTSDTILQNIIGLSSVQTDKPEELPPVHSVEIIEGEKLIELLWNRPYYKNYYSAYNVYRLDKISNSWRKLNKRPVSYLAYKDENKYIFRDSVTQNYVVYQYKIEGITPYASTGPLSDIISAQGRDRTPPDAPYNVKTQFLGNKRMQITWEVNKVDKDIAGFRISRSNEIDKGFIELTGEVLPPATRTFIDTSCNEFINNYYFIGVMDKEGNVNVSMPRYGTIIDSIPPSPPVGLTGSIDSAGIVRINWKLGKEPDLKGYFVHYSNDIRHTFINVTNFHLEDTTWTDTIPLNVLTEKIYYKVVAIDYRSNYSFYSNVLTLKKPDFVPPASPVFINSISKPNGIEIQWYNSSSTDVVSHILYRRKRGQKDFEEIYRGNSNTDKTNYTDKTVEGGITYEYNIIAIDDAGLLSKRIGLLTATGYQVKAIGSIQSFTLKKETSPRTCLLSWKYDGQPDVRFVIYRSINNQPYALFKSLSKVYSWKDVNIRKGEVIRYKIKVVNSDGWQSKFSNELEAKWE